MEICPFLEFLDQYGPEMLFNFLKKIFFLTLHYCSFPNSQLYMIQNMEKNDHHISSNIISRN